MLSLEEILPILSIVAFLITIALLVYKFGKWRQKTETDREEIKRKLDAISKKVEKIPDDLMAKSIDIYKMYEKIRENLQSSTRERNKDE